MYFYNVSPNTNDSWYRLYSDGWCEQGGKCYINKTKTINLSKNYNNTNYDVFVSSTDTDNNTIVPGAGSVSTSSSILIITALNNTGFSVNVHWETKGYIS